MLVQVLSKKKEYKGAKFRDMVRVKGDSIYSGGFESECTLDSEVVGMQCQTTSTVRTAQLSGLLNHPQTIACASFP